MNKKITTILVLTTMILISGCSVKEKLNNYKYDRMAIKTIKQSKNNSTLKNSVNQIHVEKTYVDLSYNKRLSIILKELGKLENRSYYLKINSKSEDITVPAISNQYEVRIKTFNDLNTYLENVLNEKLVIIKNEFNVNKVKVLELKNINELKNSLSNIDININATKGNFKEVMKDLAKKINYNIIYGSDIDIDMNNLIVNYSGNNISSFLKYIEDSFNLYVTIDYNYKIITFNKYKKRFFNLVISYKWFFIT